jgi:hypothetical protein
MRLLGQCCRSLATLSRAAAKAASAKLRAAGLGTRIDEAAFQRRLETCQRCPLVVFHQGASHCGTPLLRKLSRDPSIDGCGCPIRAKARDPAEHCPIDPDHRPAEPHAPHAAGCPCKWCRAASAPA